MAMSSGAMGQPENDRGAWNSRLGFILAAVGSAVGLGNIVRFPFSVADNGGAAFVVIYLGILFIVGLPVMLAELSMGRRGKLNPVGTLRRLSNGSKLWTSVGWLFVATSVFIIAWYSVIAGEVLHYVFGSMAGSYFDDPASYYEQIREGPDALGYHFVSMFFVALVLMFGVSKGIERVVFVMMPLLLTLVVGLAIYVGFLSGASSGYSFYMRPSFDEVTTQTFIDAAGQAFFSLSLGQGAILTYASYVNERESLSENGTIISLADTGVALLGGLMVFPALAATGILGTVAPEDALFLGLTGAFAELGGATGRTVGTIFWTALYFAAFTSAISLLEVSISFVRDQWGISRKRAGLLMGLVAYSGGIVLAFNFDWWVFAQGDLTSTIVILGGLLISIFVGWVMVDVKEEMDRGGRFKLGTYAHFMVRYPIPVILIALLALTLWGWFGQALYDDIVALAP